jgi:hypothetical protein
MLSAGERLAAASDQQTSSDKGKNFHYDGGCETCQESRRADIYARSVNKIVVE